MDDSVNGFPLSARVRNQVQNELWKDCQPAAHAPHSNNLKSTYFEYYTTLCQQSLRDGGIHLVLTRHSEIIRVAQLILRHPSTWDDVKSLVIFHYQGKTESVGAYDEAVCTTINLCASLLLMGHVGIHRYGTLGGYSLPWGRHRTFRQAVQDYFQAQKSLIPDNQRIGSIFTARNLNQISGIKIKWTDNIVDHLRLTDDEQNVFIFTCVGFLKFQQSFAEPIFPDGFLEETLRTLTLLFPANDRRSRLWLKGILSSNDQVDKQLSSCGSLRSHERRFEGFSYWHDRLVILKQAFDDSSPRTLSQWWNDRRNSVQWYTFWVAIMVFIITVVFGVIQSVEGGLQVYFSWKSLHS